MKRLAVILALLFSVAGAAVAETPPCTGDDLLKQMQSYKPAAYAALRAEADAVVNGKGLLWRVEPPSGVKPSYLFGTVHLTDPRVHKLAPAMAQALHESPTVIVESTDALTSAELAKRMFSVATLMVLPEGETLASILPPAELAEVKAFYDNEDGGFDAVVKYRPYMLAMILSFAPCEVARQAEGLESLDADIAGIAKKSGTNLVGLETLVEQFSSMAAMPMPDQVDWLLQAIKFTADINHIIETMVRLYLAQDTGMLLAWSRELAKQTASENAWESFKALLIDARNKRMAERALPYVEQGNAFIAVGALHLPGENGLVELLRKAGYKVTPVK